MRTLSRVALIGLIGGASAACSTDTMRLSDPFTNPFSSSASSDPGATGSLPEGEGVAAPVRSAPIQSRSLAAPGAASAPVPLSSRPAAAMSPRVASTAPVTGSTAGWTAQGGTTITVGPGDTLSQMSTRFGVPSAAILSANGLSGPGQIAPGRQIVIPVYHAGGSAMTTRAAPPAPAPRLALAPANRPAPAAEA
ncbi:LysM peptidoglycan-binding domain-containing protein, partial [Methylobacterium crusticola]|uniref:LysM peptidoglycan-binding domain-containing protein n=1 Tax=Methylobacterium crusticola TaxID=1697972 RepID=UPI003B8A6247